MRSILQNNCVVYCKLLCELQVEKFGKMHGKVRITIGGNIMRVKVRGTLHSIVRSLVCCKECIIWRCKVCSLVLNVVRSIMQSIVRDKLCSKMRSRLRG